MSSLTETYNYYFIEQSDPRVHNWPLIAEPWSLLWIILVYFFGIYVLLPSYMADKKPYSLKKVIAAYNVFQVIACSTLIYGVATSGWTTGYTFGCQPVDYSEDKLAMRMAKFMWWHMMLKMTELIETVFFVLRKKSNQVTGLHVYHHVSTFIIAWCACKYAPGGMITFTVLINSFVHVLMYTYYFLASLGPKMQNKLQVVKSKLTIIQLLQLCIILIHSAQILYPTCTVPNLVAYAYIPNIIINVVLFIKFYKNSYLKKQKTI